MRQICGIMRVNAVIMHELSVTGTTLACSLMQEYNFVVQTHQPIRLCSTFSTACTIFLYILMNNAGYMRNLTKTRMITNNAENSASAELRYPVGTESVIHGRNGWQIWQEKMPSSTAAKLQPGYRQRCVWWPGPAPAS